MKKTSNNDHEVTAKNRGRKISIIVHLVFLGLLAFPFLQMVAPETTNDIKIVMDFSNGSSVEGAKVAKKTATTSKSIDLSTPPKAEPVITSHKEEKVVLKEDIKTPTSVVEEVVSDPVEKRPGDKTASNNPDIESGMGAGEKGEGDKVEGGTSNGNGRGFIEGSGVLTRAVIDRGDTKKLAQKNGTLILKICINRRGIVTFAEWDKEASSIKDTSIARMALDNVLKYRFENDRNAPSKECGRLTYIIDVD